jgi:sulfate adenylyltransferase subunit 1
MTTLTAQPTLFRFATAGSVDDGKSTLVGRLLHDSKAILADQLESVARTSLERGFGGDQPKLDLALLTDGLRSEREQGITIDVAYRYFATDRRSFILADCPGHVQYTKNTVTGASTADALVVLVDARHGVLEQTRRHLAVARLLRVPHVIVAVNKIDLVDYSESRFREVESDVQTVADQLGLSIIVIPVSALEGDNVVDPSAKTPWYHGETLIRILESLPDVDVADADDASFRFPVQTVIRPQGGLAPGLNEDDFRDYRGYAGQIASGVVRIGDRVTVLPDGGTTTVDGIDTADGALEEARAPQSVILRLADQLDVTRGSLLAAADHAPEGIREFRARVAWLGTKPGRAGAKVLVKHGTATVKAFLVEVTSRLDLADFQESAAAELELNDIGTVHLRLASEIPLEDYEQHRRTGAFLVIDPLSGNTLAAGIGLDATERVRFEADSYGI